MSYGKYFYQNKNENDDICIYPNKNLKQEYKNYPLSSKNKSNTGIQTILNYQNKSSRNINTNENIQNTNYYISSSLKDQILSPGDDDISPNYTKSKIQTSKLSNYLDDDIIFNRLNYHYLSKNNNPFSLINNQSNQSKNYTKLNINSNVNIKNNNKKTLILDLDETLVHSSFKPIDYNNVMHKPDIFLNIDFRGNNHNVYVLKRPYVHEFLKEMNKIYNIIIFTASVKEYANPLLDNLDTEKVIKKRLFREDCCIGATGKFIKDLKVLNMNLKDLILVDNNPISYSYNICNGVPIKTWHFDKTDQELIKLIPVLQFLSNVNDVRDYIPKIVENDEIDFRKINLMINELNNGNEQNKHHKPRARSQKRYLQKTKEKRNNSINYGYNNNIINNNNLDIKTRQRLLYEESKTNLEIYNKNNNKNKNYNEIINENNNMRIIKNTNLNEDFNPQENKKESKHKENNFEFRNNLKYNYNNYLLNNHNLPSKNNNIKSEISKKQENRDSSTKTYLKNNNNAPSIQSYYKKNYLNENIYTFNNNYLNNEYQNYPRNKSQNYTNIIKDKKEIPNISINNNTSLYKNIRNNNIQFINENINKLSNDDRIDNQKKNFLFGYETKLNNGYTTPQTNNKYSSNYSIHPLSTKNNNTNININNDKYLSFNNVQGNNEKIKDNKNNKEKYYMNNNNINGETEKNNSSNFIRFFKELNKNDYKYKYNYLKKSVNNFEISNNRNNTNKETNNNNEFNNHIYNNTAINFYQAKANNHNNIFNNNLNSNSNLNIYFNNLYNKEESKISNIINKEKEDEKLDNNLKKHNSPYQISKETNYYIKRRMKLNKEKILNKKKEKDNNLYVSFNNQKEGKENFLNNNNNYFYNIQQKYFNNERENYLYVNKKY